jgi:DNA-binding response OmpR family regulator
MSEPTILVVTGDDALRQDIMDALSGGAGYKTTCVGTFDEALEKIVTQDFTLVVTDVHLPVMNGFDLMAVINSLRPDMSVMLIDEEIQPKSAMAALRLGAVDYLYRPLDMDFVLLRVHQELHRQAMQAEQKEQAATAQPRRAEGREHLLNPATRPLALVLNRNQYLSIEHELTLLSKQTHAEFVGLFDSEHNLISAIGELAHADLLSIKRALTADTRNARLAALLKEEHFSHTYLEGSRHNVFTIGFGKFYSASLVTICTADTKPGMVWLWCKRTADSIDGVMKAVSLPVLSTT